MKKNKKINDKELEIIKEKIIRILKKHKIKKAGIFGSYARGEQKKNSDVDILIEPAKGMGLLDLSGIKIELEDNLKKKVDVITYRYVHPYIKKSVLENELRII